MELLIHLGSTQWTARWKTCITPPENDDIVDYFDINGQRQTSGRWAYERALKLNPKHGHNAEYSRPDTKVAEKNKTIEVKAGTTSTTIVPTKTSFYDGFKDKAPATPAVEAAPQRPKGSFYDKFPNPQ